jgi:hypothetical protein
MRTRPRWLTRFSSDSFPLSARGLFTNGQANHCAFVAAGAAMHTQVIKDDAIKSPDFAVNCKIDPSTDQPQFLQLTAKKRDHDRATAGSSSKRWGVVIGRHRLFQYNIGISSRKCCADGNISL